MWGKAELVDHPEPLQPISRVGQNPRIPREIDRIAGHEGYHRHPCGGQLPDLRLGPRPWRIYHDSVKRAQLVGQQRAPGQIAQLGRDRVQAGGAPPSRIKRGQRRGKPLDRMNSRALRQGKGEGAAAGKQVQDIAGASDRLPHRRQQRGLPFGRGLQEGAGGRE